MGTEEETDKDKNNFFVKQQTEKNKEINYLNEQAQKNKDEHSGTLNIFWFGIYSSSNYVIFLY